MVELDEEHLTQIIRNVAPCNGKDGDGWSGGLGRGFPRWAAVLVPFLHKDDHWHLLFTRRTDSVADHKGQVAFPGGGYEEGDAYPEGTALREAQEEIGLAPQDVKLLGCLNQMHTGTGYLITPVVGIIPWPYPLKTSPDEVATVFTIPLDWLAVPGNREERPYPSPIGTRQVIYFRTYQGEVLWGVSAKIVANLLTLLDF